MIHHGGRDRDYARGCDRVHDDARAHDYGYAHSDCGKNDRDRDARENIFDVQHFLSSFLRPEIFRGAFLPFFIRVF